MKNIIKGRYLFAVQTLRDEILSKGWQHGFGAYSPVGLLENEQQ